MSDSIQTARLEIIAAKARILADASKRGFWDGELNRGLDEIEREIQQLRSNSPDYNRGGWGDR